MGVIALEALAILIFVFFLDIYRPGTGNSSGKMATGLQSTETGTPVASPTALPATPMETMPATATASELPVLLSEDFEDGKFQKAGYIYGDWQIVPDETGNSIYDMDNSQQKGFPSIDFSTPRSSDFSFRFRMRMLDSGTGWTVVEFRRTEDGSQKYVVSIQMDNVSLYYTDTGYNWTSITTRAYPLSTDDWHQVQIDARGSEIKVTVDDYVVINTDDTRYTSGFFNIQVGDYSHVQFDDFQILSLTGGK